jgi:hypothetical protein
MHVEVDGLAQLVAELLEPARIEAGKVDLDLRTCRMTSSPGMRWSASDRTRRGLDWTLAQGLSNPSCM